MDFKYTYDTRAPDQNSMDFTIADYHIHTRGITYNKTRHFYGENIDEV